MAAGLDAGLQSLEGGNPQIVLDEARSQADEDWSPDGSAIVFGRSSELMTDDSTPKTIQILHLRTRVLSTLPGSEDLFAPRWSPDGRHIAARPLDQGRLMVFDRVAGKWANLGAASGRLNNPRVVEGWKAHHPGQPEHSKGFNRAAGNARCILQ
jgi:Tol biopolymer transport system component